MANTLPATNEGKVQLFFVAYYGRPADPAGLSWWAGNLASNGGNLSQITTAFGESAEAQKVYGGLGTSEAVNALYVQMFGHDADAAGLLWWTQAIENKQVKLSDLPIQLYIGAQGTDLAAINNKLTLANSFSAALDTAPEIIAYNGVPSMAPAKALLAEVGSSPASLTAAQAKVGAVIDSIVYPQAVASTVGGVEDVAINGVVTAIDVQGDALTYSVVTGPAHGTLVLHSDGQYTYTPAANYNGTDSFTFRANDGKVDSLPGTVTLNVASVNDAPIAQAVIAADVEDAVKVDILPSATDVDLPYGDELTYSVNTQPSNGSVTFNGATGKFEYVPNANFHGTDTFTYKVTDTAGATSVATISVAIASVNDAPVAKDASGVALEGGAVLAGSVSATDVDSASLTFALNAAAPAGLTFNANGSYSFDPSVAAYNSMALGETKVLNIGYTVSDNDPVDPKTDGTKVLQIVITGTNDAPVAEAVRATGLEDAAAISIAPIAGDADLTDTHEFAVATQPSNGSVSWNEATQKFDYVPNKDYNGTDSFTYRVTDNHGASSVATATIIVESVNDKPIAKAAGGVALEGGSVLVGAVAATDVDSTALTYALETAAPAGLTFNANGTFSFDPNVAAYNSLAAGEVKILELHYTVSDNHPTDPKSDTGDLVITITGTNDAPTAQAILASGNEDAAKVLLAPVVADVDTLDTHTIEVNTEPSNGTVTFNDATGNFEYVPNKDFNGTDSFTYRVTDNHGGTAVATATVTVVSVNDAPVALGGNGVALEGGDVVYGQVTGSDVDSPKLSYALNGTAPAGLTFNASGNFSFDPTVAAYQDLAAGEIRVITVPYTVKDNDPTNELSDNTGVLTITVTGTNDGPVAQAVANTGNEDNTISVAPNASDVDTSDTHTFSVAANPSNGTVVWNEGTQKFDYTPNLNFNGIDTFQYRVTDNNGASAVATATITVNAVNDAPTATPTTLLPGVQGRTFTFTEARILANTADVDGDALHISSLTVDPLLGTVVENLNPDGTSAGTWTFTPASFEVTKVTFDVIISDNGTPSKSVTTTATTVLGESLFNLTTAVDVETNYKVYNSQPEYTPGGNDFVNTLQDEDNLTGTAASDDTLNAIIGSVNDNAETIIAPKLTSIERVNVEITSGADNAVGLDFQDTDGVRELNVNRITASNSKVVFQSLQDSTTALSLSNAVRNGNVEFNWAEGQLSADDNTVDLTLTNVQQNRVALTAGDTLNNGDISEDEGFGIETLNVVVNGPTNVDEFFVEANVEEQQNSLLALPGVPGGSVPWIDQTINLTANALTEINQLNAQGLEFLNIEANADVKITGNERPNRDGNVNRGLDLGDADSTFITPELRQINITGSGDVWLNGVTSGNGWDFMSDSDVVVDGSTMTGNLAIRLLDDVASDPGSSVDSGSGDDEVITTTDTSATITTRAGDDYVHIGQIEAYMPLSGPSSGGDLNAQVSTGSGADQVYVHGNINANIDTGSAEDSDADGDIVWGEDNLNDADISTGRGNDHVSIQGAVQNDADITTAEGSDEVWVGGSQSAASDVSTGEDNDTVTFGASTAGTINTADGDDTLSIGGSASGDYAKATGTHTPANTLDLGTGNDTASIAVDLNTVLAAGSASESTAAGNGNDSVTIGGDIGGRGKVTTEGGNDTVVVGDDLLVQDGDFVGSDDITTETAFGGARNGEGAGKTVSGSHFDVTAAASIETGAGNDRVSIGGNLYSAPQWNDNVINSGGDFNVDDNIVIVGAKVLLGSGEDTLVIGDYTHRSSGGSDADNASPVLAEGTLVDAGDDNDNVTINHNTSVVLAADNSAFDAFGSSLAGNPGPIPAAPSGVSYTTREAVGPLPSAQDTAGAIVDLGNGDDTLTFNDVPYDVSPNPASQTASISNNPFSGLTTLIDRGAEVRGGQGTDTLTVHTVDDIDVVRSRAWEAIDTNRDVNGATDAIIVGGVNQNDTKDGQGGYITGIETINLVIENTVDPYEVNNGADTTSTAVGVLNGIATDDGVWSQTSEDLHAWPGRVRLDVAQVDEDLQVVNLQSNEQRLELENTAPFHSDAEAEFEDPMNIDGYPNGYLHGTPSEFEVDNFGRGIELNLSAYEVTGLTPWNTGDLGVHDGDASDGAHPWDSEAFSTSATNLNPEVVGENSEWPGEGRNTRDDCEIDVTVEVNMDRFWTDLVDGKPQNSGFAINLNNNTALANQTGEENYDVEIISEDEYAMSDDGVTVVTTAEEDDALVPYDYDGDGTPDSLVESLATDGLLVGVYARDIEINVNTGANHAIELSDTFGGGVPGTAVSDALFGHATSLTVNVAPVAAAPGTQTIELNNVRADVVLITGAANTFLYTAGENLFNITGGNGDDLIDVRSDTFNYDSITGGGGTDTLVIAGDQSITGFGSTGEFWNINEINNLMVVFDEGYSDAAELDVDSGDLDEIQIVNTNFPQSEEGIADSDDLDGSPVGVHTVDIGVTHYVPGSTQKLVVNADIDTSMGMDPAFCNETPDSNRHSDTLVLNINTQANDNGVKPLTDLDVIVNVAEGTTVNLINHAAENARVFVTVSALADTVINDNGHTVGDVSEPNGGDDEGELQLHVGSNPAPLSAPVDVGGIDLLKLVNNEEDGQGTETHNVFVKVEDTWANNVKDGADLEIDASDLDDTKGRWFSATEGFVINEFNAGSNGDQPQETNANLLIKGTQDDDDINGGLKADTLYGNDGNDLIYGGATNDTVGGGNDALYGGNGDDQLAGDNDGELIAQGGRDTLDGGADNDLLYGGVRSDTLTGGSGADTFVYTRLADSNGQLQESTDLITDFSYAQGDKIDVRYLAYDAQVIENWTSVFDHDGKDFSETELVFGRIDEVVGQQGGNAVDYADATALAHAHNGLIEVIYQRDAGVLWFDLNDDGSLDNNDLRIRVPQGTKVDGLYGEFNGNALLGLDRSDFFGPVYTSGSDYEFRGGTVVSDHVVIVDADVNTDGTTDGLTPFGSSNGALALFGGNDQVTVEGSQDILVDLGDGNDRLIGSEGNETIYGGEGDDNVEANGGDDYVFGGNGDDTVDGGAGADWLEATPGNDSLIGGTENDTMISTAGNDTLYGGQGNDSMMAGDDNDWAWGGEGNDFIDAGSGDDNVAGEQGDDTIEGGEGNNTITGGDGNDNITSESGADNIDGGSDNDEIWSGAGDDTVFGSFGEDSIYGGDGYDLIDGGADNDWIDGGGEDDTITGDEGRDTIEGQSGNDILDGGSDGDSVTGGSGNDSLCGDDGDDSLDGGADNDTIEGGQGADNIDGGNGNDQIDGGSENDMIDAGTGDDSVVGGTGNDSVIGDSGKDTIQGGEGNDTVYGGSDADLIDGENGEDFLYGDTGNDTITAGEGNDSVDGGSDDDLINGGTGNDDIFGSDGNDSVDAGLGDDYVDGGAGNDTLVGSSTSDSLDDDDVILGGTGNDSILGLDGSDDLVGGEGNDTIRGGDENDFIEGNEGDDLLEGEEGDDIIGGGNLMEVGMAIGMMMSAGSDASAFDAAQALLELAVLGDEDGKDTITGGIGNDVIFGGGNDDVVDGGADNDYIVGDAPLFVEFLLGEDSLPVAPVFGGWSPEVYGNDSLLGGSGNDTIEGDLGLDTILGGTGNDVLFGDYGIGFGGIPFFGPIGSSTVFGAVGNDIYNIGDDDSILGGDGNDSIFAAGGNDFVDGGANDDGIMGGWGNDTILGGSGSDDIFGDGIMFGGSDAAGDDSILGGGDNDRITAGAGNDFVDGGTENDSILGGDGNDTLLGGVGADTILGGNGDDSILGGGGADSLFGDAGADTISGSDDGDWINGGTGNDVLNGDGGNDTILGGSDADVIHGNADNDSLLGDTGNDTLYGDAGNDYLTGGSDDDWLLGGDGSDSIYGNEGADSVFGDDGNDFVDLLDGASGSDASQTDWLHLSVGSTVDSAGGALGTDTITGFNTSDVDLAGPNFDGDYLALWKDDVTNGTSQSIVQVTDWSNDAFYRTYNASFDTTSNSDDYFDTWYDDATEDTVGTVGEGGQSIADASLVIVKTGYESDDDLARYPFSQDIDTPVDGQGVAFDTVVDGSTAGDMNGTTNDFEFRYDTAAGVDAFLKAQNGSFNGSVFVITDNAAEAGGNVYLWWDKDASDQNGGSGASFGNDTYLVGTFTDLQDAEAFWNNVKWMDNPAGLF